jgi:hypothetical protein
MGRLPPTKLRSQPRKDAARDKRDEVGRVLEGEWDAGRGDRHTGPGQPSDVRSSMNGVATENVEECSSATMRRSTEYRKLKN